nr:unnamed protein product [Callosobruchus analis]
MQYEDRRGEVTTSWMAELGLIAINKGRQPIFVRGQSTSILDITLATECIAGECRNWKVLVKESLSLHRYIFFTVGAEESNRETTSASGWCFKRLDLGDFNSELYKQILWRNVQTADDLRRVLTAACHASMSRKTRKRNKGPDYWWTQEIACLRRDCLRARRAYTKRNLPDHVREILGLSYKQATGSYFQQYAWDHPCQKCRWKRRRTLSRHFSRNKQE